MRKFILNVLKYKLHRSDNGLNFVSSGVLVNKNIRKCDIPELHENIKKRLNWIFLH